MANGASFFSRFTMKFVEVVGAGIATAVTGYLIAHFGGYYSKPAPAPSAMEAAPSGSVATKAPRIQPASLPTGTGSTPAATHADTAAPADAEPAKDAAARASMTPAALPASARKHPADSGVVEAKAREEIKSREDAKAREKDDTASVEEQVRAALAKVDANRRPLPDAAQPVDVPPPMPAAAISPRPTEPAAASVAAVPSAITAPVAATAVPPPVAIVPPAPAMPAPLNSVEVKSQPVAAVDPASTPPAADKPERQERGFFATIQHLPEMLRPTAGATTAEPPRPPMPVGDSQ